METGMLVIIVAVLLVIIALKIKAIRKATGLVLVVLGILATFTGIGMIIGVPMIFIGGILLFAN